MYTYIYMIYKRTHMYIYTFINICIHICIYIYIYILKTHWCSNKYLYTHIGAAAAEIVQRDIAVQKDQSVYGVWVEYPPGAFSSLQTFCITNTARMRLHIY